MLARHYVLTRSFPPRVKGREGGDEGLVSEGHLPVLRLGGNLDALGLAVGLAAVDLLARLGNGLEDRLVGQRRLGDHDSLLLLEGDLVGLDACRWGRNEVSHCLFGLLPWRNAVRRKGTGYAAKGTWENGKAMRGERAGSCVK